MFKKIKLLTFLTLIVGVFVSCSSSNPYVDDAQSKLRSGEYEAALEAAEQSIANMPQDPLGYYYKGVVLGDIAQDTDDPAERRKIYEEMNASFEEARELADQMEDPPGELENLGAVKTAIWSNEHNRAIEFATNDSLKGTVDQPIRMAIDHLVNATTIIPDSTLSWDVLAEVYFMDKNMEGAIKAKSRVIEQKDPAAADDYVRLADFYRVAGQSEGAIEVLTEARDLYPNHVGINEKLADAYMGAGDFQKAISTVEKLIATDPENPQYHLALGTQYYQTVLRMNDSLSTTYDRIFDLQQEMKNSSGSEAQQIKQQISELQGTTKSLQSRIETLTDNAVAELETVLEYRPDDASAYNTLGIIYQNKASALFEERNQTTDNQRAAALDKQARQQLKEAMKYYEKAASIDPDNKEYWQSLYRVYVALGMDEKAKEAEQKAGM